MEVKKISQLAAEAEVEFTEEDVNREKSWLREYYKDIGYPGDIEKKVDSTIQTAITLKGKNVPKSLNLRVKRLLKHVKYQDWINGKYDKKIEEPVILDVDISEDNIDKNLYNRLGKRVAEETELDIEEVEWNEDEDGNEIEVDNDIRKAIAEENNDNSEDKEIKRKEEELKQKLMEDYSSQADEVSKIYGDSIIDFLKEDERAYWIKRESEYRKEFDFNESSDRILLEEAIYLEVLLRRMRIANLNGQPIKGYKEEALLDQHKKVLEKLGVLRLQRIQSDKNIEGNVSEISVLLEKKLNEIRELKDKNLYEKTLLSIGKKYGFFMLDEIEDVLEEQALKLECDRMEPINPIHSAVYKTIEESISSSAGGN